MFQSRARNATADGEAGEDQRRRAGQRLAQRELRAGGALEHQRRTRPTARRRPASTSSAATASVTATRARADRAMAPAQRRRRLAAQAAWAASCSKPCPAISRPSARDRASAAREPAPTGGRDTSRRCGRTSARISSRSSEISSTAAPASRAVEQLLVHVGDRADVEAPGRLVGEDEARVARSSSARPRISFCMLPPDSEPHAACRATGSARRSRAIDRLGEAARPARQSSKPRAANGGVR